MIWDSCPRRERSRVADEFLGPVQRDRRPVRFRSGALPTPERLARFGLDVARAWHHHGRHDKALHALIQAERYGPEDVRRPSVRALITEIASAPGSPAGAKEFAARIGATV